MSTRRVPLADNPNAANSPYRASTASKRQRACTEDFADHERNPSPPKKKQLVDLNSNGLRHRVPVEDPECNSHLEKQPASRETWKRRLVAARETKQQPQRALERNEHSATAERELIRTWRKQYRKVFPTLVFYFDNLPSDICLKASRQVTALGAREEKFFSRNVSHVVTTRHVPSKAGESSQSDSTGSLRSQFAQGSHPHNSTINPSLLEKTNGGQAASLPQRTRQVLEGQNQKRQHLPWQDLEARRHQGGGNDILHKARELGIKVWPLEKFERTILTLISKEPDEEVNNHRKARERPPAVKSQKETDLQQLLHNERHNAPTDRAPWQEIVPFRGYYIYVHDMDERVKPVMARDYAKPSEGEEGEWPMLHAVSKGRCPFIPEPKPDDEDQSKDKPAREEKKKNEKSREEVRKAGKQEEKADAREISTTRRAEKPDPSHKEMVQPKEERSLASNVTNEPPQIVKTSVEQAASYGINNKASPSTAKVRPSGEYPRTRSATRSPQKPPLQNDPQAANRMMRPSMPAPPVKPLNPPPLTRNSSNIEGMPPNAGSAQACFRGIANHPGGEPMASGVRPNVTSAIRSQMISSTAAAPNAKTGTSRQMHQLNRRVLERQSGLSANSNPSSVNVNDVRAAINAERAPVLRRTTRQQATQTMARIREEEAVTENSQKPKTTRDAKATEEKGKAAAAKKESKPGYCENCREKFDDFEEHVNTRKHKKFASELENWAELDNLLKKLVRH